MARQLIPSVLLLLTTGCAATQVTLLTKAEVYSAGERKVLPPGEVLRPKERFAVTIEVDRTAYVYLVHATPSGEGEIIFAQASGRPLQPGPPLRVPQEGDWYPAGDGGQEELLYVLASSTPLGDLPADVCRALSLRPCRLSLSPELQGIGRSADDPPPEPVTIKTRTLSAAVPPDTHVARSGKGGVAVLRLTLQRPAR